MDNIIIDGVLFESGMAVSCCIEGDYVEGHLYIRGNRMWICHDNPSHDGDTSEELFGHRYSWVFHYRPESGRFSDAISNLACLEINNIKFKQVGIEESLMQHLSFFLTKKQISFIFKSKTKPFEFYKRFRRSEKTGYIILEGETTTKSGDTQTKKTEIKFSRFLKKTDDAIKELSGNSIFKNDHEIEKAYNSYVATGQDSFFELVFVSGEDIRYGYDSKNYSKISSGTLQKSCMSDKFGCIKIYEKNPDKIQLAILKSVEGIEARCLIWTLEDDKKYFDRIYYTKDWCESLMKNKLIAAGYVSIQDSLPSLRTASVTLSESAFLEYPYIDTFRYRRKNTNQFFAAYNTSDLTAGSYDVFIHTTGSVASLTV